MTSHLEKRVMRTVRPNVKLVDRWRGDGGRWTVESGTTVGEAMMDYINRLLVAHQAAEPDADWHLETRGTVADWHRWGCRS